jgi:GDP-4-dehydro-6-deoxy-D-mannose reductase
VAGRHEHGHAYVFPWYRSFAIEGLVLRILITGVSGFVSQHFLDFLEENRIRADVLGVDVLENRELSQNYSSITWRLERIDLLDGSAIERLLQDFRPDYVLHLASYSSVAFSWKSPVISFQNNTNIFLSLVEAIRKTGIRTRVLSVGSSEEYGNSASGDSPLTEESPLDPLSPYAVARVAQEYLSRIYAAGFGLDIVITRSFNHIGPRQRDAFVVSSFARQLAGMKRSGESSGSIRTGDLSIVRDFLDVRDVVRAYYLLLEQGRSGQVYNVCSGRGHSLGEILATLASLVDVKISVEVDPDLLRPNDNHVIVGSNRKLVQSTGWAPVVPLERSLREMLEYWESAA